MYTMCDMFKQGNQEVTGSNPCLPLLVRFIRSLCTKRACSLHGGEMKREGQSLRGGSSTVPRCVTLVKGIYDERELKEI